MTERWLKANKEAEARRDWSVLMPFYAEAATYCYTIGAFGRREARGFDEVRRLVMDRDMVGFDGWTFPYDWLVIDGDKIMTKWHMVPPFKRKDGTAYRVLGMSAIRIDNDLKIVEMEDSMDIAAFFALVDELRRDGHDVKLPSAPSL
ncbi:MAG: nuclear transport factor 2 family protein [Myxococcales bacterium]|nr:nuclear transport factor 2 family protein [Myxococcales bacterium]